MREKVQAERSILLFRQSYDLTFCKRKFKTQSVALATDSAKRKGNRLEIPHYA